MHLLFADIDYLFIDDDADAPRRFIADLR